MADIQAGRLSGPELAENFADVHRPLSGAEALAEANRCYFCYDAPCINACPTGIDIPGFIRAIATGNVGGAAMTILQENIFGGSCARVCPTEILCQGACVRNDPPLAIGLLQRHATDHLKPGAPHPFSRAPDTGRKVAVVGAGPAGLSCAHGLARQGHEVVVFEARDKPGGLNEFGIAAYKLPDNFAQHEVGFILAIGGVELRHGQQVKLGQLRRDFDAVFIGVGQGGVRGLDLPGMDLAGVHNAVDYIAALRQTDLAGLPVGAKVVVIGGGNTAIDIAVQSKRLGAEDVTIAYRRGPKQMARPVTNRISRKSTVCGSSTGCNPCALRVREARCGRRFLPLPRQLSKRLSPAIWSSRPWAKLMRPWRMMGWSWRMGALPSTGMAGLHYRMFGPAGIALRARI
jgi:glutamate synthase (NADPH/NADH) small chain